MKRTIASISLVWLAAAAGFSYAGSEPAFDKTVKEVAPTPCPEWYADNEWNVTIWGTYAFAGNDGHERVGNTFRFNRNFAVFNLSPFFSSDRYLENDHAWGGGVDVKYFFRRYFGVGVEGFVLDSKRNTIDISAPVPLVFSVARSEERRVVGSFLGTLTLRYPIHCSRLSPYVWAGGGGIFNGGERDILIVDNTKPNLSLRTEHNGGMAQAVGQVGGGLEFRFTRHIGWTNDFSWNIVDGPDNNYGMVRSGLNFSF